MPSVVIKTARDRDQYVVWSTVADGACEIGTRADMLTYLAREVPRGYTPNPGNGPEERLRRADECGTTALWGEPPYFGAFDDTGFVVEGRWWLNRADLPAYCDALMRGDESAAQALLADCEDDEDDEDGPAPVVSRPDGGDPDA